GREGEIGPALPRACRCSALTRRSAKKLQEFVRGQTRLIDELSKKTEFQDGVIREAEGRGRVGAQEYHVVSALRRNSKPMRATAFRKSWPETSTRELPRVTCRTRAPAARGTRSRS